MTIGERIKHLRIQCDLSQSELADAAETTKQTIHKYETGIISNIPASKIKAMADRLNTTPAYLMGWEDEDNKTPAPNITEDYTAFPVIGEVAAGYEHIAVEDWDGETVDIPNSYLKNREPDEFFVLRVKGDSMYPAFQDGDKVLVLKQPSLDYSGQVGVVIYEGEYGTLKKVEFVKGQDWMRMVPINPTHPPVLIKGPDLEQCRILGIPKLLIREINE